MEGQSRLPLVDRQPLHVLVRLTEGFGETRVRVDGAHQFLNRVFQLDADDGFVNQIRRVGADDVDTKEFAVLLFGDDLDETIALVDRHGFAQVAEGEGAGFDGVAFVSGFLFGQADGGDFGFGVNAGGDGFVVDGRRVAADVLGGDDAFHRRDVGEAAAGHIADGVDAGDVGFHALVDRGSRYA